MIYSSGNQVSALKGIFLTLVGIGLVLGLALYGSDLVNPFESLAQYERDRVETQHVAQQNEIDLAHYAAVSEAQTRAELQQLADETAYRQQSYRQALQHAQLANAQELQAAQEQAALRMQLVRLAGYTAIAAIGVSLSAVGVGGAIYISRLQPVTRPVQARVRVQSDAEEWTPEEKRRAIAAARQQEQCERQLLAEQHTSHDLFRETDHSNTARTSADLFEDLISLQS